MTEREIRKHQRAGANKAIAFFSPFIILAFIVIFFP
jgi:hypothetical protein